MSAAMISGLNPGGVGPIKGGGPALAARASANSANAPNGFHSAVPSACTRLCALSRPSAIHRRNSSTLTGPYSFLSAPMILYMLSAEVHFLLNCGESLQRELQLIPSVSCGDLRADASLALRNDRIGKSDHIDTFVEHSISEARSQRGIAEHYGNNRVCAGQNSEAETRDSLPKEACVVFQFVSQFGRRAQ